MPRMTMIEVPFILLKVTLLFVTFLKDLIANPYSVFLAHIEFFIVYF